MGSITTLFRSSWCRYACSYLYSYSHIRIRNFSLGTHYLERSNIRKYKTVRAPGTVQNVRTDNGTVQHVVRVKKLRRKRYLSDYLERSNARKYKTRNLLSSKMIPIRIRIRIRIRNFSLGTHIERSNARKYARVSCVRDQSRSVAT